MNSVVEELAKRAVHRTGVGVVVPETAGHIERELQPEPEVVGMDPHVVVPVPQRLKRLKHANKCIKQQPSIQYNNKIKLYQKLVGVRDQKTAGFMSLTSRAVLCLMKTPRLPLAHIKTSR